MKAIETEYNGYLFRSRLEARWAVFFDTLGIEYRYEPEGFELEDGTHYLPDFWLPAQDVWAEIKPDKPDLSEPNVREYELCEALARESGKVVWLIGGTPGYGPHEERPDMKEWFYSIAIFTPEMFVERADSCPAGIEPSFGVHHWFDWSKLREQFFNRSSRLYGVVYRYFSDNPDCPHRGEAHKLIEWDRRFYKERYDKENPNWHYEIASDSWVFEDFEPEGEGRSYQWLTLGQGFYDVSEDILDALKEARQARFEHGQVGAPSEWTK